MQLAAIVEGKAISAVESAVSTVSGKAVSADSNSKDGAGDRPSKLPPVAANPAVRRGWKRKRKR